MSSTVSLDVLKTPAPPSYDGLHVAVVGNPNCGKTTLFNMLTGMRARTANIAGTTVETRVGKAQINGSAVTLIDLPGMYSLSDPSPEQQIARQALLGEMPQGKSSGGDKPGAILLMLDATNIQRNLLLAGQAIELGMPTVVALNMCDLAERAGIKIDTESLSEELGCKVVPICARTGDGLTELRDALHDRFASEDPHVVPEALGACATCGGCQFRARFDWAEGVEQRCARRPMGEHDPVTDAADRVLTHPILGVLSFGGIMFMMFALVFWVAAYPMDWIDMSFGALGEWAGAMLPEGDFSSLVVDGVIAGLGGVVIFLPQICLLFFFISLLENTGYLARAAVVSDRLMRRVGLPGTAFVPLISAHACAIPAIMASRVIENRRDRLVTIMVAPLLTCSARLPVYAMIAALLVPGSALLKAAIFSGGYFIGIAAALLIAMLLNLTLLKGKAQPLVIELPGYKAPNLRNALITMYERGFAFLKKAGTVILLISIMLWATMTYPKSEAPAEAVALQQQAEVLLTDGQAEQAEALLAEADSLTAGHSLANSAAGRVGQFIEPAIEPMGYDWKIGIGIVSSFAAREVVVSTLSIIHSVGDEDEATLYETMRNATLADGTPMYSTATCLSLLVFFILAMQCLPTNIVAAKEAGSWRWAVFQFGYMTVLAYGMAWLTFVTTNAVIG